MPVLHRSALADIDPRTLYLLAMLRQDVFTLEQKATDADLDGRELDASTTVMWLEVPGPLAERAGLTGEPIAHLRVLPEEDGTARIGRVAVRADHRRGGHGRALMEAAIAHIAQTAPAAEVHIDAQAYLEQWYASMGFETVSEMFWEAGIEHVAMVRRPAQAGEDPSIARISARSK
ncbi:GNAT family N-acetyltransferase [Brachybacterium ginsengisoli]|uniref:GNAT family N-acetyltransferase n=1 Tax=Brachybacterium ginsengisoli TaxID=1331682 RepID=A0A291GYD7_9MICO|nr:GNAT family N-acetyltransferase [Brachybacterium ginsengisoli]ATG55241.1 GNAT family N-acetyltransferase [Brachybacterium ginsengisoli]